ncbi:MAG TPA: AMP-binding protein, partial [Methylomirabilota bacterium]|nr:AMP-binding protein [Methylomirabilota bacterium]
MAAHRAQGLPALSFAERLAATARRVAARTALVDDGGAVLTYAELDARAGVFAERLARAGAAPGNRVAVCLPNGVPFVVAVLGALRAGVTVATLDPLLRPEERAAIESDLEPALTLDDPRAVLAAGAPLPARRRGARASADGPLAPPPLILYTSGSTGRPKGAVLSDAAVTFANESWAGPVMALREDDVVLAALPLA